MTTSGDVTINVEDGGGSAVRVPASTVQLVVGCSTAGTAAQLVATRSLQTLSSTFTGGPLPEAAALSVLRGGTVLAMRAATNTAGTIVGAANPTTAITGATNATPIVITSASHLRITGDIVTIAGVGGNTAANGTFRVVVLSSSTFQLVGSVGNGAYTSGGTVQFVGVTTPTFTGTSVPTATGTPTDDMNIQLVVTAGGTIGVAGIMFTVSLDAGRSTGPNIPLGTGTSYVIPGTGVTVAFAAGTLVVGDTIRVSTTAPIWNTAGVAACLAAFLASPYATIGIGSIHIVGVTNGAAAATFQSGSPGMDQLAAAYVFSRAICSARDAALPQAWCGAGETESAWMTAILADFAAASAKRIMAAAGHYNFPSAFANSVAGAPRFRRPFGWAQAARQVAIPPQRHSGRVKEEESNGIRISGSMEMIVVDPTSDPNDGFIYHDERSNPGLDFETGGAGRFASARTRIGLPGIYTVNPLLLSPAGSDFDIMPKGLVMDVACSIVHQVAQQFVNDDLRLNDGKTGTVGTLYENDAREIENQVRNAIKEQMTDAGMISGATVSVDRTNNVATTKKVLIAIKVIARGYVSEVVVTIGFQNQAAAA